MAAFKQTQQQLDLLRSENKQLRELDSQRETIQVLIKAFLIKYHSRFILLYF